MFVIQQQTGCALASLLYVACAWQIDKLLYESASENDSEAESEEEVNRILGLAAPLLAVELSCFDVNCSAGGR